MMFQLTHDETPDTSDWQQFPSPQRSVLLQLYRSSQEDPEVRIAAYQQLMRCPDQNVFTVVKVTLRNETSSQGWSLTVILHTLDLQRMNLYSLVSGKLFIFF